MFTCLWGRKQLQLLEDYGVYVWMDDFIAIEEVNDRELYPGLGSITQVIE